ncbi:unnamed protein product, partial [Ectocarpus sp. 13 AM-2016]
LASPPASERRVRLGLTTRTSAQREGGRGSASAQPCKHMADVVDLVLSDEDDGGGTTSGGIEKTGQVQEVDLSSELVVVKSPTAAASSRPAAGAQTGRAARRKSGGAAASPGVGSGGRGHASRSSPNKRNNSKSAVAASAAAAAQNAVLIDDDGDVTAQNACSSCFKEVRNPFPLERCGHTLCPGCLLTRASASECPVDGCSKPVSVRDLALILDENGWVDLQVKRVAAFRARARKGARCPKCQSWVEGGSTSAPSQRKQGGDVAEVGKGGGTAKERVKVLLSGQPLVCNQGHLLCRFCAAELSKKAPRCVACGDAKLLPVSGLLSLLEELVVNPASVELCGPVGTLPKTFATGAAAAAGRGRGGRGRGGRGGYVYPGGRGGGGGRGMGGGRGAGWAALMAGFGELGGFGQGYGYNGGGGGGGGGGGAPKISSKWSKGTGYGGSGDAAAAASTQAVAAEAEGRADKAMVVVFDALTGCLPARGDSPEHLPELLALVRESSLLQSVCAYLRNDSLMDIAKRRKLYQSLFKLVLGFAQHELLAPLIDRVPPKSGGAMTELEASASSSGSGDADSRSGKGKGKGRASSDEDLAVAGVDGEGDAEEEDEDVSVAELLASANRQARVFAQAPGAGDGKGGDTGTLAFALQVTEVYDKVKASLTYLRGIAEARASSPAVLALASAMGAGGGVAGAGLGRKRKREAADIVEVSLESRYLSELGDSRFELVALLGPGHSHHFSGQASSQTGGAGGRARAVRISQEVSTLATSLPVQPDSSIFLRVDEDRFDVMRAMVTGPKGTPYECGCFEFDILLPPDYPNSPPKVHFLTTGSGRVRFNPNLYQTGKVCLSLLGTWAGPGWNPKTSTLLQVLISIQSLIFVAEPYFNEPGFEGQLGTPQGRAASSSYNTRIRNGTLLLGVLEALEEKRPGALSDVKRTHFRLMKGQVMRTARSWLDDLGAQG